MSRTTHKRQFELETLEPRILLSASQLAPAVAPQSNSLNSATVVANSNESASHLTSGFDSADLQAAATQIEQILAGSSQAETPSIASPEVAPANPKTDTDTPTSNPQNSSAQTASATIAEPSNASSQNVADSSVAGTPSQVSGNSTTEQLTDTLRSANGPPTVQSLDDATRLHLLPGIDPGLSEDLVLHPGDSLTGTGSLGVGLINNGGLLSPGNSPGTTHVTSFSQGPGGVTLIEIGGTAGQGIDPNGWDQVQVDNLAELDGTLQIALYNGFVPTVGQSFVIFTWGSRSGQFANWLGTAGIPGHPELAFKPVYNANNLTLQVIQTPTVIPGVQGAVNSGLNTLGQAGTFLNSIGNFATNIPLIGSQIGNLVDSGSAIVNVLQNRLNSFLAGTPTESYVTGQIQALHNTTVGGFLIHVNGVLGHYGTVGSDPFWWDLDIDLIPSAVNRTLQNIAGGALGATFSSAPSVQVTSKLNLRVGVGYDSGFFLQMDHLIAEANVNVSGLSGFPFNLAPPGGPLSLNVTNGSVNLSAAITVTPDSSVLTANATTGPRIEASTLSTIASNSTNVANSFNLVKSSSLNASFTLNGALTGFVVNFSGILSVHIQSNDLFSGANPDVTLVLTSTIQLFGTETLNGTFTFVNTGTETDIIATNLSLDLNLGTGGTRVLHAQNGSGTFALLGSDLAGTASLTITQGPNIPGLTINGTTLNLAFNTSSGAVTTINGTTVNLPAGPYYRISGHGIIGMTVPQANLDADFVFEPKNTDANSANGNEEVDIGVANLTFSFVDNLSTSL